MSHVNENVSNIDTLEAAVMADIGAAGDEEFKDERAYVPPSAVERARKMLEDAEAKGVKVVLPIDFVLDDGRVVTDIPARSWQLDVGPATRKHFEEQALAVHEKNLELMRAGIFNPWIEKSLDALARLMPGRYAKRELSSGPIASLDGYAYQPPLRPAPTAQAEALPVAPEPAPPANQVEDANAL